MKRKAAISFGTIITLLFLSLVSTVCNRNETNPFPTPADGCTYFTMDYELPQTQSAEQLAQYLASEHLEYDLDGWFFFGSLVDSTTPDDLGIFFIAVQRIEEEVDGFRIPTVPAIVGFNSKSRGNYLFRGVMSIDIDPLVSVSSDPWSVNLTSPLQEGPLITMSLISGTMGQVDATYNLTANIPDIDGTPLKVEVQIRDRFGAINEGDGTASFFAQFLTDSQRDQIMNSKDRKVSTYLEETGDPMSCQGSYYYSLPLLDVENFSIKLNDTVISNGNDGLLWMDYVVQSYDEKALEAIQDVSWQFFAIQLPEINTALMVIEITTKTGTLPIAKLFDLESEKTLNFASKAKQSWAINEINIEPVSGSKWVSPKSGKEYNTQHRIQLMSNDYPADFVVSMITDDQEIYIEFPDGNGGVKKMIKYEGMATVEGTIAGSQISGQAFVELQPVGGRK